MTFPAKNKSNTLQGTHETNDKLLNSILLIDKPEGITSFDTVKEIQKITGIDKIGHSGTLDRFASGLLLLCCGQATKLARYLLEDDKRYTGCIQLGTTTDTDDREGSIIDTRPTAGITEKDIRNTVQKFTGAILQVPPKYSALKINGKRASDRIRGGESVELRERNIMIFSFEVSGFDADTAKIFFHVHCSKGTYVRSLARDIGRELGTGAFLDRLRRTAAGQFHIDNALTLAGLREYVVGIPSSKHCVLMPAEALSNYSRIIIRNDIRKRVLNGAGFSREDILLIDDKKGKIFIILDENENLIAIADMDIEKWHIKYLNVFNINNY